MVTSRIVWDDKRQGLSSIYNEYVDDLLSYGTSLGFDIETCKDAVHDVFYKIHISNPDFQRIENVKAYLFRSLKNRLYDLLKKTKKLDPVELNETGPNVVKIFNINLTILDNIVSAEEEAILKSKVSSLLDLLTPRQKEVIYLRYMQKLKYSEIAPLLNMKPESVRKLVCRSIRKLYNHAKSRADLLSITVFLTAIRAV